MSGDAPLAGRTLLVLAATANQVPLILRARDLGARVVTVDNRPDNPGHALAESRHADLSDPAAVIAVAREVRADGVLAAATDVAVLAAAEVGVALGLPAPTVEAARILTSKSAFRALQDRLGLPRPAWDRDGAGVPVPCLAKPCLGSGSRGIAIVARAADLPAALAAARAASLDREAIVEELLPGTQHTFEGILTGGRVAACVVTERLTAAPPHVATRGHRVPATLTAPVEADVSRQLETIFAALGQADGPFDADVVATPGGPVILEVSPRSGGNALMRLVAAATGTDHLGWLVSRALGADLPAPRWSPRPAGCDVLGDAHGGTLRYNPAALAPLRAEPWCFHLDLDVPPGTPVPPFTDGRCRFGEAVVTGADRAEVEARLSAIRARLSLAVA